MLAVSLDLVDRGAQAKPDSAVELDSSKRSTIHASRG